VTVRVKLLLLLSAALAVTTMVSSMLRLRWTRSRLESQLQETAKSTAEAIASELQKRLPDTDTDEDVKDLLQRLLAHHPVVSEIVWLPESDEEIAKTFSIQPDMEEAIVARRQRTQSPRVRTERQRREDARRALLDHGQSSRRPGSRTVESLLRTTGTVDPGRWPAPVAPEPSPPQGRTVRTGERGQTAVYEFRTLVEPDGARRGELTIAVSREPIEQLIREEKIASTVITAAAMGLLVLFTLLVVDRVVGRPVNELSTAMKRVESGDLSPRVEPRRNDELGRLQHGFNDMIGRLQEADAEIRAFNRRLADEVRRATDDLATKNEALSRLNRLLFETRRELGDKERLAALGQLAAQLAHEIGTPLGSVSGHLQLAISNRELPPAQKERLGVAVQELQRISTIVRDYLDSTRRVAPARAEVDVTQTVDDALGIALGAGERQSVRVERALHDPGRITSDAGLLRQILINLLTNAADAVVAAHPDGSGTVIVAAERSGDRVRLSVADNGHGIAAEDLARIFEPFYTTKGRGKGTGLGLAICRELAIALGGRISVDSAPGRGSRFELEIPLEPPPPIEQSGDWQALDRAARR
jgi:signal transduction histidine kinase